MLVILRELTCLLTNAVLALNIFLCVSKMKDKDLIRSLGGPTKVARLLGYEGAKGVARVAMWTRRGIPAKVKLEHIGLFVRPLLDSAGKETSKK